MRISARAIRFALISASALLSFPWSVAQTPAAAPSVRKPAHRATKRAAPAQRPAELAPQPSNEEKTARFFDSIHNDPQRLLPFLHDMPKGADLHNHLWGAVYAETLIDLAASSGLCVTTDTYRLVPPPCDATKNTIAVSNTAMPNGFYDQLIEAWSMRNWNPARDSGHDHFFATFDKFGLVASTHTGELIADATNHAAEDRLTYLELMHTADGDLAAELANKLEWTDDPVEMRKRLLDSGMAGVVAQTRKQLDIAEDRRIEVQRCRYLSATRGCAISVRYLYQVLRGLPKPIVFAQILLGFELAKADPRFVGLNLVMPEDGYTSMHDFDLHMRILAFMRPLYPGVHLALHAGELAPGLVPPEGIRSHISDSVDLVGAERIGHGVDVMHERGAEELLQRMAEHNVLVEICLTSNAGILGVTGKDHPFAQYRRAGVPFAFATDDAGVNRSSMTQEWLRAVAEQGAGYLDLKSSARQSLEHSFMPGKSLWAEASAAHFRRTSECGSDEPDVLQLTPACTAYLGGSEKAQFQWSLERELAVFEKQF